MERLVVHENAQPAAVEQYRRLAAVLHQAQVERGIKIVMVASAQAAEGKTLTAANLGLTLSESYRRRVLLIDADLRRPSLSALFQLPNTPGLGEGLKAPEGHQLEFINLTESLALLPGGRPDHDPMSGLISGRMQRLLAQAAEGFDWVILDTPPVALLSDTPLLAAMVDVAVMVVNAGSSQCDVVQKAVESIGRDKVIGVVLNRVESDVLKATHYDYYYGSNAAGLRKPESFMGRPPVAQGSGISKPAGR
jgi:capsular exopolysaccharide synthesis family protein